MMAAARRCFGSTGCPGRLAGAVTLRSWLARCCGTGPLGGLSRPIGRALRCQACLALSDVTGSQPGGSGRLAEERTWWGLPLPVPGLCAYWFEQMQMAFRCRLRMLDLAGRSRRVPRVYVRLRVGIDPRSTQPRSLPFSGGRVYEHLFSGVSALGCTRAPARTDAPQQCGPPMGFFRVCAARSPRPPGLGPAQGWSPGEPLLAAGCNTPAPRVWSKPSRW